VNCQKHLPPMYAVKSIAKVKLHQHMVLRESFQVSSGRMHSTFTPTGSTNSQLMGVEKRSQFLGSKRVSTQVLAFCGLSVCLHASPCAVGHDREPCGNGYTDRDAAWKGRLAWADVPNKPLLDGMHISATCREILWIDLCGGCDADYRYHHFNHLSPIGANA